MGQTASANFAVMRLSTVILPIYEWAEGRDDLAPGRGSWGSTPATPTTT